MLNAVLVLLVILLLFFSRSINAKQTIELRHLKEKKQLVLRIPEFEKRLSSLSLTGIISTDNGPAAVINNRIVRIGDKIGTNKVIQIKGDSVVLNDGSKDFELKLTE